MTQFAGMSTTSPLARKLRGVTEAELAAERRHRDKAERRVEALECELREVRAEREDFARQLQSVEERKRTSVGAICNEVAEKHCLSAADIFGRARAKEVVSARHEAFFRIASETEISLMQIGRMFSRLDHSTVYYGVLTHAARHDLKPPRGMSFDGNKRFQRVLHRIPISGGITSTIGASETKLLRSTDSAVHRPASTSDPVKQ